MTDLSFRVFFFSQGPCYPVLTLQRSVLHVCQYEVRTVFAAHSTSLDLGAVAPWPEA